MMAALFLDVILPFSKNFHFLFNFLIEFFSFSLLSFTFAVCSIFSRFSQASTQCLSCRSPTAQLVICANGPLS